MSVDLKAELSEEFAVRIVNCCKHLKKVFDETVMSKQLLRSGTSIGANIAESVYAESKEDFKHKLRISLKEASETKYWLKILWRTEYLSDIEYNSLYKDCELIIKVLTKIVSPKLFI